MAGGLIDQLRVAMAFEARALAAGVDMAELGHNPPARWMSDPEQTLTELLTALPSKLGRLSQSANNLP